MERLCPTSGLTQALPCPSAHFCLLSCHLHHCHPLLIYPAPCAMLSTLCSLYACVSSCFTHVRHFVAPWTIARQAPPSMGILQASILEWVAIPSFRGSSQSRDQTQVSSISCLGCCCCSVAQSCPTLCDPMNCSTPGFPVLHHLPEFVQTHVH